MIPILAATFTTMIVLLTWGTINPKIEAASIKRTAEAKATNFWAYRGAVVAYVVANPAATGTIPDSSLSFPLGHVRDPAWTNVVQSGKPYIYAVGSLPKNTVDVIWRQGRQSLNIGLANSSNTMTSINGLATGQPVPATVPAGALVVVGK